jgi:tRNA(Met) C34 N-acetyltransferase TmcA
MKKNQMMVTDDLAASGAPLCDDEFVVYLLAVLDEEYNLVFTAIVVQTDPISPSELYAQLLSFEQHTALQMVSALGGSTFAFTASRGHGSSSSHGAEVVATLHMSDSYTMALTVPPVHPGPNARFA